MRKIYDICINILRIKNSNSCINTKDCEFQYSKLNMRDVRENIRKCTPKKSKSLSVTPLPSMLMYGKEASNRKQEIDRQHYTIPNQRPKDKHCGKI